MLPRLDIPDGTAWLVHVDPSVVPSAVPEKSTARHATGEVHATPVISPLLAAGGKVMVVQVAPPSRVSMIAPDWPAPADPPA